jgi:preprotein translocase subunit SecE
MSSEEKLDTQPKRRRWRRSQVEEEEVVDTAVEEDEDAEDEGDSSIVTSKKGRATPSRRQLQEAEVEDGGNVVTRPVNRLTQYLRDVRSELAKVTWPTREEAIALTRIVLLTTVVASLILGVITLLFTELFRYGLQAPIIFVGLFVIVIALVVMYIRRSNTRTTPY